MPKRKAADSAASSPSSLSSTRSSHAHCVYPVIKATHSRSDYAFHSGDNVNIIAVYTTAQAANVAAMNHLVSLRSDHDEVHCNDNGGMLEIVAEGGMDDDMMVYVEKHDVITEEASATVEKLTEMLKQASKEARQRRRAEEKKQEGEDG